MKMFHHLTAAKNMLFFFKNSNLSKYRHSTDYVSITGFTQLHYNIVSPLPIMCSFFSGPPCKYFCSTGSCRLIYNLKTQFYPRLNRSLPRNCCQKVLQRRCLINNKLLKASREPSQFEILIQDRCNQQSFLPRDTMHKRGLCHRAVSVRPSVRRSARVLVTFVYCVKTSNHNLKLFTSR